MSVGQRVTSRSAGEYANEERRKREMVMMGSKKADVASSVRTRSGPTKSVRSTGTDANQNQVKRRLLSGDVNGDRMCKCVFAIEQIQFLNDERLGRSRKIMM